MGFDIGAFGQQAAGDVLGATLGLALEGHEDARQLNQQQRLQELQMAGQKGMAMFNQDLAYEMWKKTGPVGQMEQLRKAGLNPGLIYGMGGAGGATASVTPGNVSGADAPKGGSEIPAMIGLQLQGAQLQLLNAQKANIEADTAKKQAEVPKTQTETASLAQGIENQKASQKLTEIDTKLKQLQFNFENASLSDRLDIIAQEARRTTGEATRALIQANVDETTEQTKINSIRATYVQQMLQQALTKAQTENVQQATTESKSNVMLNAEKYRAIANEILKGWANTSNDNQRTELLRTQTGNTDDNIINQLLQGIKHLF